jgi:hypothetical protein
LELLSSSLNNSKGFSKKAINFSEFQAFGIGLPGLADISRDPRFGENKPIPWGPILGLKGKRRFAASAKSQDRRAAAAR